MIESIDNEIRDTRLESVALSEAATIKSPTPSNEPIICCSPFLFGRLDSKYKIYNGNDFLCCVCIDWCGWFYNIKCTKSICCQYDYTCFACCCSITFE